MRSSWADLETLKAFLEEKVCNRIYLKATDDDFEDETYRLRLEHPKVSVMRARLSETNPDAYSAPQVIIRFIRKEEPPVRESSFEFYRIYYVELEVWVWNNGVHSRELMELTPNRGLHLKSCEEPIEYYPGDDGSKDAMHLCDMIETALKDYEWLDQEQSVWIDRDEQFITGPASTEYGPANFEPYFCHLMQFRMVSFIQRNNTDARRGLQRRH